MSFSGLIPRCGSALDGPVAGSGLPSTVTPMKKRSGTPYYVAPKPWWRRVAPAVAAVIFLGLLTGIYVSRDSDQLDGVNVGEVGGVGALHRVYLDGWSYRILDGASVYAGATDAPITLNFTPLDVEGLKKAVERDPEIVQNTVARLVTGDATLRCTTSGCTTRNGPVDLEQLADLSNVPGLGSSYRAWSVTAGMYVAEFRAPEGSVIAIGAENWDDLVVQEAPALPTDQTYVIGEFGTKVPVAELGDSTGAMFGYGRRTWDVAAAWGQFFIPEATWENEEPTVHYRADGATAEVPETVAGTFDGTFLAHGLSDRAAHPAVDGLNASQLTYFSSPVTGCGVAALCAPTSVKVNVKSIARETGQVCNGDRHAVAVAYTNEWDATLLGQVHIFGAWNGKEPTSFIGAGHRSVLGYSGAPELIGGMLSTRQANIALIGADGDVFAIAGSRGQIGVDVAEYTNATSRLADLEQYFDGDWERC